MKNPPDGVVDGLGFGKGLMTTFMSDDPEAGCKETGEKAVERPKGKSGKRVEGRVGEGNNGGVNERVEQRGGLVEGTNDGKVPEAVCGLGWTR